MQHIFSVAHKQKVRANVYNGYICELSREYASKAENAEGEIQESMDSESTKQTTEYEHFVASKSAKKEQKAKEKELERSHQWTNALQEPAETLNLFDNTRII